MGNQNFKTFFYYTAIALMIPTFIVVIFYRDRYPILSLTLVIGGIAVLAIITFVDFDKKKEKDPENPPENEQEEQ